MTQSFTQKKFLSLRPEKQHKLLAELLREHYLHPSPPTLSAYNLYLSWLGKPPQSNLNQEEASTLYHQHLAEAGVYLTEPRFLPSIKQQDTGKALPSLGYTFYLDDLRSAHNVGSILRTVEAFQLGSVLFSPYTPWIDQKKVRDASMGTWEWVECKQSILDTLQGPLIALETAHEAELLSEAAIPKHSTFILGNEEYGCSAAALAKADKIVKIPLRGKKNSLNVSNAFAILAYHLACL